MELATKMVFFFFLPDISVLHNTYKLQYKHLLEHQKLSSVKNCITNFYSSQTETILILHHQSFSRVSSFNFHKKCKEIRCFILIFHLFFGSYFCCLLFTTSFLFNLIVFTLWRHWLWRVFINNFHWKQT